MKNLLIISAILLSTVCFGQIQPKFEKYDKLKTTKPIIALDDNALLRVIYLDKTEEKPNTAAIFINGTLVNNYTLRSINPEYVGTISVEKGDVEINNVKYSAKILIETKADYTPNFISLNDFKEKHISTRKKSVVFQIDDEIVQGDYDKYLVDENYILRAIVEKVKIQNKKMNFTLIKLLTISEKNISDSKRIMIRGQDGVATVK